jgi:hypothetical protein
MSARTLNETYTVLLRHNELIENQVVDAIWEAESAPGFGFTRLWQNAPITRRSCREAMLALGNMRLACEMDAQDVELAANYELAEELEQNGACWEGMVAVGLKARSWAHLKQLCADADKHEWIEWVEDTFEFEFLNDRDWFGEDAGA